MNITDRPQDEVRRFNHFKLGMLFLFALLIALTQWRVPEANVVVQMNIPTPAPRIAPTEIMLSAPSLSINTLATSVVNNAVTMHGFGTPEHIVSLWRDGVLQGQAVVGADGRWSYEVDLTDAGQSTWTASETDGLGRVSAESSPLLLEVMPPPNALVLVMPTIPDDFSGGDIMLTGSADVGSMVSILLNERIYDVATADETGMWEYTLALTERGNHTIAAQLIDATIDAVLTSDTFEVTVASDG